MPCLVVIRKKEDRPEAADRSKSKARNQRWMDFLRSTTGTGDLTPIAEVKQGQSRVEGSRELQA